MSASIHSTQTRHSAVILVAVVLLAVSCVVGGDHVRAAQQSSDCQGGVGGRVFSNGGSLEVEILPTTAGFTSELHFVSPGPPRLIATNRDAGTVVKLGNFPQGAELVFSIFVQATQKTFVMGPGSNNPDGLPHASVTCFGNGSANVGFEDQSGGGDQNFADLIFAIRQPITCTFGVSPASQSFDSSGGSGAIRVTANKGCSWGATLNSSWITINSGASGSEDGTINYTVGINNGLDQRSGTITVQGQTFTVFQDGTLPVITSTLRVAKHVYVYGTNFDSGAVILVNGEKIKTLHDDNNTKNLLIGKKLAKWAVAGDKLQVKNSTGIVSPEYTYAP